MACPKSPDSDDEFECSGHDLFYPSSCCCGIVFEGHEAAWAVKGWIKGQSSEFRRGWLTSVHLFSSTTTTLTSSCAPRAPLTRVLPNICLSTIRTRTDLLNSQMFLSWSRWCFRHVWPPGRAGTVTLLTGRDYCYYIASPIAVTMLVNRNVQHV